jgi:outer membrane lipopolysaccharide assembly protein LptE/RlpB
LTIAVSFSININAPEKDIMQLTVSRFADFESNVNLASVEAQLIEEIDEQISQDVINKLLSNW